MVTACRVSPPMSIHMVTRRTTQRQLLLRPDKALVQCYYYILGYLQTRHRVEYHNMTVLSNHLHLLLTDLEGDQVQAFNREFFSLMARSTNCYRGRNENLWSSGKPSCVCVAPRTEDIVDKCAYIITNPVEAGLVSHAKKWPGVRVLAHDMGRLQLRVQRPGFFFRESGDLPEEVVVRFTLPKVWDSTEKALREQIADESRRREESIRDRFRRADQKFLGVKRVCRSSTRSSATSPEEWFKLSPHVACKDRVLRGKFLKWRRVRQRRYEECRSEILAGGESLAFPSGTYVLHFVYGHPREPWKG